VANERAADARFIAGRTVDPGTWRFSPFWAVDDDSDRSSSVDGLPAYAQFTDFATAPRDDPRAALLTPPGDHDDDERDRRHRDVTVVQVTVSGAAVRHPPVLAPFRRRPCRAATASVMLQEAIPTAASWLDDGFQFRDAARSPASARDLAPGYCAAEITPRPSRSAAARTPDQRFTPR
jgi:hypothetical protein